MCTVTGALHSLWFVQVRPETCSSFVKLVIIEQVSRSECRRKSQYEE